MGFGKKILMIYQLFIFPLKFIYLVLFVSQVSIRQGQSEISAKFFINHIKLSIQIF